MSTLKKSCSYRGFQPQHLVCVALLVPILGQLLIGPVHAAEDTADPYDVLYDVLMTRWKDGKSYAQNETSPAIFAWSEFPFDDETFKKFDAALDEFAALPQERIEQYSDVKRALLQRHLWKVFDTTFNWDWWEEKPGWGWGGRRYFPKTHMDRRKASQPRLVSLIRRLALTREQILALPNPLAATVKSGGFATAHDPEDRFKPFLPTDLYVKDSSFICLGEDQHEIPVAQHTGKLNARSMFLQFMSLLGGRTETLEYMARVKQKAEQFPVGTQFALIEQPFLISDDGEMILSPMIVSVQLRAYLDVDRRAHEARPEATQCVTEFVMQPRQLMKGNAVMRALTSKDFRYEAGSEFAAGFSPKDPFATGDITEGLPRFTRLKSCMDCHGGKPGVRTQQFREIRFSFKESGPDEISKATVALKHDYKDWKRLRELWQADVKNEGKQSRRPDQAQRRSGSTDAPSKKPLPELRRSAPRSGLQIAQASPEAETKTADPYDALYDVIMTRYGPDGKTYGANESSPTIFHRATFPFGDSTYNKLNAAVDALGDLPQKKIEAYSDIQRALMQRHLWHVFDAMAPYRWTEGDHQFVHGKSFQDRRDALRPKIASLIQRLALTKAQILALPDTRAATINSGGFSRRHDPSDPFKPFLSSEIFSKESSWVCIGFDSEPPAPFHSKKLKYRSAFLTFMRLPRGRSETLEYIKTGTQERGNVQHFPVGTQFAFMEQAFLISDEGEMVLSPLIVGISMRAYLDVELGFWKTRPPTQALAEFVMQPRQLMQGNAVMKALGQQDLRLEAGDVDGFGVASDPFEKSDGVEPSRRRKNMLRKPRLTLCMSCHRERGVDGVGGGAGLFGVKEKSPEEVVNSSLTYKRDHHTWKSLSELWHADPSGDETQSGVRTDPPKPLLDNNGKPDDRRRATTVVPRSAFDKLYDVLMVRHARNGVAYGENEIAPMIFKFSGFPFDDATYPKLTAALDAITSEQIKSYSNVQRAILQRQLWALFDATAPSRVFRRRPDDARRLAVQKQLAGLIRQLALKRTEIESLPDSLLTTVKAKKYPTEFNLEKPTSPFLPPDLTEDSSPWICFGRGRTPVNLHATDGRWRSAFFQFIRLPGERQATIEYIDRWSKEKVFPVGTQVALIEKAFLVSDKGEMVLSPMTVSTRLRAYRNVEQSFRDAGTATQCVAEFISRPRDYLRGSALMAAASPTDHRLKTFRSDGGKQDVLELVNDPKTSLQTRLGQCMNCHGGAGANSLGDVVAPRGTLKSLQRRSQSEIVQATAKAKQDDKSWKLLQTAWNKATR